MPTPQSSKWAVAAMLAFVLAGCGGDGANPSTSTSTPDPTPTDQGKKVSRKNLLKLLNRGIKNSAGVRQDTSAEALKSNAFKPFAPRPDLLRSKGKLKTRADGEEEPLQYDSDAGVWVREQWGDIDDPTVGSGFVFFADEAGTIPAGGDLMYSNDGSTSPMWFREEIDYTAGKYAGTHVVDYIENSENGMGLRRMTGVYPGEGSYKLDGDWDEAGAGVWTQHWTFENGTWENEVWTTREDFSHTLVITTSQGITFDLVWNDDNSGSGTIKGEGEGLPAALLWNGEGNGTITWSDGTTTLVAGWEF